MSYEYKELIKAYTEYIMDDYEVVDLDYIEAGKELDEVYRKAKAFDEIKNYLSRPSPIDEDRDEVQKIIDEYDKEDR